MERGFSPLDEELGLLPGRLTPSLHEGLTRLGTWLPFAPAAALLAHFTAVTVSASTARRQTEAAGAAQVAIQAAEVARLTQTLPDPPAGPPIQQFTVDGAFVPLVGGDWAEVKTLTIGTVQPPTWSARAQAWLPRTTDLSYFSRLADHETFSWQATVETHRRGTTTAGTVCAVVDGAGWCQQCIDLHRPDAVRILDFPHAVGYLAHAAQAVWGADSAAAQQWASQQAQALLTTGPDAVLAALQALEPLDAVATALGYLTPRRAQLQYPTFRAAGYPIGSGCGESANKLVVEARLKGSGMHWQRAHVDAMLAMRAIACNDRWDAAWLQIHARLRRQARQRTSRRPVAHPSTPAAAVVARAAPQPGHAPVPPTRTSTAAQAVTSAAAGRWRPAADHPWRRQRIGRGLPTQCRAET